MAECVLGALPTRPIDVRIRRRAMQSPHVAHPMLVAP